VSPDPDPSGRRSDPGHWRYSSGGLSWGSPGNLGRQPGPHVGPTVQPLTHRQPTGQQRDWHHLDIETALERYRCANPTRLSASRRPGATSDWPGSLEIPPKGRRSQWGGRRPGRGRLLSPPRRRPPTAGTGPGGLSACCWRSSAFRPLWGDHPRQQAALQGGRQHCRRAESCRQPAGARRKGHEELGRGQPPAAEEPGRVRLPGRGPWHLLGCRYRPPAGHNSSPPRLRHGSIFNEEESTAGYESIQLHVV